MKDRRTYQCGRQWLAIVVALWVLTGCTIALPPLGTPDATPGSTLPGNGAAPLAGTNWTLTGLGADASTPVVADTTVTLAFDSAGHAGGDSGCNSFGGDYTTSGETISFGALISTMMACMDSNVMDQEQAYLAALNSADRYALANDQLTIWYDGGMLIFTAAAATPVPTAATTVTPLPIVTPAPTPGPSEPPERIEFAPGATSAERSGLLPSGPGTLQYVLTANAGQTMTVDATSDGAPLSMTIADPTGFSMIPEMREVEGGYAIGAQYTLPATGDYVVTLQKGDHTPSTNFTVTFTIQ
jgi:heat shock protein HslJ